MTKNNTNKTSLIITDVKMPFIIGKKEMIEKELRQKRKNKWVQQIIATACVEVDVVEA